MTYQHPWEHYHNFSAWHLCWEPHWLPPRCSSIFLQSDRRIPSWRPAAARGTFWLNSSVVAEVSKIWSRRISLHSSSCRDCPATHRSLWFQFLAACWQRGRSDPRTPDGRGPGSRTRVPGLRSVASSGWYSICPERCCSTCTRSCCPTDNGNIQTMNFCSN